MIADKTNDVVQFKWTKGPAVSKSTFGTPASGAPQYALCLYDLSGGSRGSGFKATASGDVDCSDQACWIENKRGGRLKNKGGAPDGIVQLTRTEGEVDGKSKVQVKRPITWPQECRSPQQRVVHFDTTAVHDCRYASPLRID